MEDQMAKKLSKGISRIVSTAKRRAKKTEKILGLEIPSMKASGKSYKSILSKIKASPLSLYVAGGVGAFFLGRFAIRYYKSHPEISTFLKENFDTVEEKLREYKNNMMSDEAEARH
jgi:hypothetical protein